MSDFYQTGLGHDGTFDTAYWWQMLRSGIDGPLGDVLDVGCAEGVMCSLALDDGATSATGFDHNAERIALAREHEPRAVFLVADAETFEVGQYRTVICSQVIHWLGEATARRYFAAATRNLAVIFRPPNDGYQVPENGIWFPTLDELGMVRTSEFSLLTQDHGKQIWSATFRTDLSIRDGWVYKRHPVNVIGLAELMAAGAPIEATLTDDGYGMPVYDGWDLHGDRPFRPRHERPVTPHPAVERLASRIAEAALSCGWVPLDFAPRNIIIANDGAHLVDLGEIEPTDGTLPEDYRVVWERSLGRPFSGRLADLCER